MAIFQGRDGMFRLKMENPSEAKTGSYNPGKQGMWQATRAKCLPVFCLRMILASNA